jgi:RNA polymerase sigma-32 factor
VHVARGYNGYGLQLADLIQEGNIGLMKAVKRFDPDQGVRLVSFAVHWIRAEMHEFILRNWRIVKVATTKAQRKLFFNLRKSKRRLGWMNHAEVQTIARDLNVPASEVLEMEARLQGQDIGFDAPSDNDDDARPAPVAYLEQHGADPSLQYAADDEEENRLEILREGLASLDARSRDIVKRRWLGDGKITLQELADEYGISAERIRQIESAAMKKMKACSPRKLRARPVNCGPCASGARVVSGVRDGNLQGLHPRSRTPAAQGSRGPQVFPPARAQLPR